MHRPEILAPAGSLESLTAALAAGADAVYLGCGAFNARRNAQNFDHQQLLQAARLCHARGVKLYLALNTLVYDRERPALLDTLALACRAGVDAVIVQDLGVAALVRQAAPTLPLHASTQMSIHNLSGARQLMELGFSRVVLAREMTRQEIASITSALPIQTEVFVHGALCMCVSGQCYMSSVIGERSGNRGLCAQPCRLPFTSGQGDGGFALSLRDLTLVDRVDQLRQLGVASLKIEGRMKRPEYVAAAVTAFRQALEGERPDLAQLEAAFSRSGFTQGYFDGRLGREMFGIRQPEDVQASRRVAKAISAQQPREFPRVPVDFTFHLQPQQPVRLIAADRQGRQAEASGPCPQPAHSRPVDRELVCRSLEKLGGTFYLPGEIHCHIAPGLSCPVSQLNGLRRQALEALTAQREQPRPHLQGEFPPGSLPPGEPSPGEPAPLSPQRSGDGRPGQPQLHAQLWSLRQLTPRLLEHCSLIALPLSELLDQGLPEGLSPAQRQRLAVSLPRLCFGDDSSQLTPQLEQVRRLGITHLTAGNLGGVWLGRQLGFSLHGEFGLNLTNAAALEQARQLGLTDAVLSFELSLPRARDLGQTHTPGLSKGVLAYGHLPLMVTRNCPLRQGRQGGCKTCPGHGRLRDRRGEGFPVRCTGRRYAQVFNPKPLYLADRWQDFTPFHFALLYFTGESPREVDGVLEDYLVRHAPRDQITRGLYYRNVK